MLTHSRIGLDLNLSQFLQLNHKCRLLKSIAAPTRPIGVWLKRGHNCIYLLDSRDIAICMDVECNPGPVDLKYHHQMRICTTQMDLQHSSERNINSSINNSVNRFLANSVYLQSQPKLLYYIHTDYCLYSASFSGRPRRHIRGKRASKRVKEKTYKINTIIGRNRFSGKDSMKSSWYLHKVNTRKSIGQF